MRAIYKFLIILGVSFSAWARPPLELNQDIMVSNEEGNAEQQAFQQAVEQVSLKLVNEAVGADVEQKQPAKIKQLLAHTEKYILFIKGSKPEPVPGNPAMVHLKVEMKISLDNFDAVLRELGLLRASLHSLKVLALIDWNDEASGQHYAWWSDEAGPTSKNWSKFVGLLSNRLKARSVQLVENPSISEVPGMLRKDHLTRDEQLTLAKQFDASLIILGDIHVVKTESGEKVEVQTELVDARADRVLNSTQTALGPYKIGDNFMPRIADTLSNQVKAAQASGRMNVASFRVTVRGRLSYQDLEQFRRQLLEQVLDIHALKDRLYTSSGEVVFEAESNRTTAELAQQIRKARFSKMKVDAEDSGSDGLVINVKTL